MLMLLVIAWPFSLAGMQLLSADLYAGRDPGLGDVLRRTKPLWTRMFVLGLVVYGSYFLLDGYSAARRPITLGRGGIDQLAPAHALPAGFRRLHGGQAFH